MRQYVTAVIITGAALLVVGMGLLVRIQTSGQPSVPLRPASQQANRRGDAPPVPPGSVSRSARVQDRLNELRMEFKERRQAQLAELRRAGQPGDPPPPTTSSAPTPDREGQKIAGLAKTLATDPDPDERISAVFFLSTADASVALPALLPALNDRDPEVRLAVVEALGDYSDELTPQLLEPALRDADPEVRFEALGLLGELEGGEALGLVRNFLHDPNEDVRALAEGILDVAGDQ